MRDERILNKRVAVVTGSDSGIGQAIAVEFARSGADVAINYLEDEGGARETERLVLAAGVRCIVVRADVASEKDVDTLFARVEAELGRPTLLVNSAGIDGAGKHVADLSLEEWNRALAINLTGPFLCSRRFIRGLLADDTRGHVINITSVHEDVPRAGAAEYCATKGGLRNLTRCLALELAPHHVTVNNIAPGMVLTPMNQEDINDPKKLAKDVESIPLRRAAQPAEVARLARFLTSEADYATGSTYVLDGGLMQNQGQGA